MIEMLILLTIIFVAYVIYVLVSEQITTANSQISQSAHESPIADFKKSIPQAVPTKEKVATVKSAASAIPKTKPTTAPQDSEKRGLKDPKTGEIATTYSNYRFTKRWIKEALVAEGLLDKVYKNDELNADIGAKIKSAVLKLEAIDKYRA